MRNIINLNENWLFAKNTTDIACREGVQVNLPHTWNAEDGFDGGRLLEEIAAGNDLRPAAVVVWSEETIDGTEATKYLSAHDAGVTLRQIQAALQRGEGIELPLLEKTEGGLRLNAS